MYPPPAALRRLKCMHAHSATRFLYLMQLDCLMLGRTLQVFNGRPLSTELNDSYVDERVALEASSTALVMVDVWTVTDPMLLDNMHKRLLPLLSAARQLGFLIVHAPSEAPLWDQLQVLPGEILVTGERGDAARCDLAIKNASQTSHRNIKHVLLVGYDTNLCVIDKPCGAVQLSTSSLRQRRSCSFATRQGLAQTSMETRTTLPTRTLT